MESKQPRTKTYIFGEIVYEMLNNPKKKPFEYDFFKKHSDMGPNQCDFLKTLISIIDKNKKTITSGKMPLGKFERILIRNLNNTFIDEIVEKNTDQRTMTTTEVEEEKKHKKNYFQKAREQFIQDMIEGYELHQEIEELQRTHPEYFNIH